MNCPTCHNPVREGAQFCTNCGARTSAGGGAQPPADSVPTVEQHAGGVTDVSAGEAGGRVGVTVEPDEEDPLVGRVLDGKYEIVSRLGAGGMGSVYRARRVLIGDEVAVKVLHTRFVNDETLVERFRREARAAAQLHHPNVVTIHDYGEARGREGFAYIVMELVRGESLRELLRREGRMTPARAVSLMRDICAGVGAAHRRGIIHRDLKPDNIIVMPADEDNPSERVKVVDFGIAKLRDMASDDGTLTAAGAVVGTPFYMSPEQCKGESLDPRADVYSLGALLYEMLAGSPPFNAPSLAGIILKHVSEPPPPLPSDVQAPRDLHIAIARSLSKDSRARQGDASEFSREIQSALSPPAPTPLLPGMPFPTSESVPSQADSQQTPAPPFSEATRPERVTPLPPQPSNPTHVHDTADAHRHSQPDARTETHAHAPAQQTHSHQPQPHAQQTHSHAQQTYPHPPAAQTHGGAPRRRSRAPLVVGVLVVLLVGATALAFVGYLVMRGPTKKTTVNVNARPTPVQANANSASPTPTPATIVVSEQMQRAEQKIVAGAPLKGEDLAGLTTQQLRLLRNAVFARYGRIFDAGELQQYFQTRTWYRARRDFNERSLTATDRANADLVKAYEDNNGAPPKVDATQVSKEVAEALDSWAESTRDRDLNAHSRAYADTLETFYKKSNVPASQVLAERARAFTRYDSMDVKIENVDFELDPSGRRATATFDKSWEFSADDKTSTGRVRQQLTFVKQGDRWLITSERDLQVYETGSEEY
ncbi:MAG TPA: protein kinase [Pyrinomonadaceae bacterium]|nr:protein kinase [Pyrinomonadaceae bacterium]